MAKCGYNAIDLGKFLFSFLVIAIHVPPFSSVHWIVNFGVVNYIARLAVPFFFVAAGFLLAKKIDFAHVDYKTIFSYILKILKLYIAWSLIYLPFSLFAQLDFSLSFKEIIWAVLLWFKGFFFTGSYGHLWYLNATIVALLLICLALKLGLSLKKIVIIGFALYLIGLLGQSYYGLFAPFEKYKLISFVAETYRDVFLTTRNGLFEGLFFISLGMMINKEPPKLSLRQSLFGFLLSMALLMAEVIFLVYSEFIREYDIYLMLAPSVYFLFLTLLKIQLPNKKIYPELRALSVLIYFVHMLAYHLIASFSETSEIINNSLVFYSLTAVISVGLSMAIRWLSKKKYGRVLNYLY